MKKFTAQMKKLWNDESGQGGTEYVLLLLVVVAIAFLFKDKFTEAVSGKLDELGNQLNSFTGGK